MQAGQVASRVDPGALATRAEYRVSPRAQETRTMETPSLATDICQAPLKFSWAGQTQVLERAHELEQAQEKTLECTQEQEKTLERT